MRSTSGRQQLLAAQHGFLVYYAGKDTIGSARIESSADAPPCET